MRNEFTTSDIWLATMLQYNGCPCIKCEGMNNNDISFTFICPSEDAKIIAEEYADPELSVLATAWISAFKMVQEYQRRARVGFGVWTDSAKYAGNTLRFDAAGKRF